MQLSLDLELPMIPIENRTEIENFTNRFNNDRIVPTLSLFTPQGHLLRENVLPEMLQQQHLADIKSNWQHYLQVIEERELAAQ